MFSSLSRQKKRDNRAGVVLPDPFAGVELWKDLPTFGTDHLVHVGTLFFCIFTELIKRFAVRRIVKVTNIFFTAFIFQPNK
jgi:hypothetical protein